MPPNQGPWELLTSRLNRIDLFTAKAQGESVPGNINDARQQEDKRKIEEESAIFK